PFTAMAVAPDGKTIAFGASWGRRNQALPIVFWDLASGDEVGHVEGLVDATQAPRAYGQRAYLALAYSPDGRTLAVLLEGRIVLVEVAAGKRRGEWGFTTAGGARPALPGAPTFGALAFSPDGRTLAAGCSDGAVRRFDLRTGRELTPLSGHSSPVVALCWT